MKTFIQTSKVLILAITVLTAASFAQAEWNNPPSSAPSNNAPTPINVSTSQQDKAGKLTASVLGTNSLCLINDGTADCRSEWGEGGGAASFDIKFVTVNSAFQTSEKTEYVNCPSSYSLISCFAGSAKQPGFLAYPEAFLDVYPDQPNNRCVFSSKDKAATLNASCIKN